MSMKDKDGIECPNCGEPNFRLLGDGKFECGNCDFYDGKVYSIDELERQAEETRNSTAVLTM